MTDLFLTLLDRNLSASFVVLAVLAARLLLKRAPKAIHCALWALVALRLVCPISFKTALSLVPEIHSPPIAVEETLPEPVQQLYWDESAKPGDRMTISYPNEQGENIIYEVYLAKDGTTQAVEPRQAQLKWPVIGTYLWLTGMIVMLLFAAFSYLRIAKQVRASIDLGNGVYLCDYIDSPFILGIGKPKIYLPSMMDPRDAGHVLAHEKAHLKRRDHWWKPLGFLLLCVHWFNPLLWLSYILLCRDIELACDERVIKTMGHSDRKTYSEALLKCSVPRHMILACPLAFGEVGVKQRIKSVLHYKKPGFWILLGSILVVMIVAVCFLTDPESHTLANILELQPKEIVQIHLWSRTSRADFETEEKIADFLEFLGTLEYDPVPAASEPVQGEMDENNWSYQTIDIYYEDREEHILFNYDYTLVWTRDAEGNNSLPYRMKDSQGLLDYLNDHVSPVVNRETSAEPFATWDQPVQWIKGIRLDALRAAQTNSGYLTNAQASKLTAILNEIPETSIGSPRFDEDFTFDHRIQSLPYILLRDDANNLTGILTYYNDSIELSLVESSDYRMDYWDNPQYTALISAIDSNEMRSFFTELIKDPPNLLVGAATGYDFREELEILSDGEFTMSFHTLENWDYEIIRPEDEEDFFGFRCRPKKEDEGWLTFGWWSDGFIPSDAEEDTQSNLYGYHYTHTRNSPVPADGDISASLRYDRAHCSHGSFVTTYENTDSWAKRYQKVTTWLPSFVTIKCETLHSLTEIPEDVAFSLANVAYYDWDSIAREIGAEHMILFDPQYYEESLFVGCQYEGGYRIACFQKTGSWDYQFLELLEPATKSLPHDKSQAVPVAEFETEDSSCLLYIIDDERVAGVECNSDLQAYISTDSHPALVLLDAGANSSIQLNLHYDTPPLLYFIEQTNGGSFEFNQSPQYYLYHCLVNYNDGRNPPGSYSLETTELNELSNLLLSLPELTRNVELPDNETLFDVYSSDEGNPKVHMLLRFDEGYQHLFGQNGVERLPLGDIRLELYYFDSNITLGVNMKDLNNDFYRDVYYFEVESPELEDFMLSKSDDSRKQVSLSAE